MICNFNWYSDQYFLGAGTAGNIGLAGVKAEVTTFVPKDRGNVLYVATMATDYTLEKWDHLRKVYCTTVVEV